MGDKSKTSKYKTLYEKDDRKLNTTETENTVIYTTQNWGPE